MDENLYSATLLLVFSSSVMFLVLVLGCFICCVMSGVWIMQCSFEFLLVL